MISIFKRTSRHINEFILERICHNSLSYCRRLTAQDTKAVLGDPLGEVLSLYKASQLFRVSLDPFEPTYQTSGKVFWTGASDDILLLINNVFYTEHLFSGVPPEPVELLQWIASIQTLALLENEDFPNDPYERLNEEALPPQEALSQTLEQLKLLKLRSDQEAYITAVLNDERTNVAMPLFKDSSLDDLLSILIRMPKRAARARFGLDLKLSNVLDENDLSLFADAEAIESIEKRRAKVLD